MKAIFDNILFMLIIFFILIVYLIIGRIKERRSLSGDEKGTIFLFIAGITLSILILAGWFG